MLEVRKVTKEYNTDGFKQKALDGVSISFRKNEFASILGASGSGKTTFLNIVGGLDHYDSGDLIINEVSTKKYKDKDWDTYRNHRVGFVFQSYNLISHQTILKNVELALTLSGVSKKERRRRAKKALKEVGLINHINKRPNQLSGGQMQRVAIARALVNNPEILLADEPTGALDSVTSKQIMELLKKIAQDKLVIMVTHNPELAMEYSTRIIKLKDGKVIDDTDPYDGSADTREEEAIRLKKTKKTSMSLWTSLGLSLNNLLTKKGRTILTAFAGSIGIIGIALILALSNGVQQYIDKTEKEALSSYPLQIEKTSFDLNSVMNSYKANDKTVCSDGKICTTDDISNSSEIVAEKAISENNLKEFKKYLDNNGGNINDYITDIGYTYNLDLQIYSANTDKIVRVNPNSLTLSQTAQDIKTYGASFETQFTRSSDVFKELIDNDDLLNSQYKVLSGRLPKNYNEMVLIVSKDNQLPLSVMYSLDIENRDELINKINKIKNGEDIKFKSIEYDYDALIKNKFKLILNTDYFQKQNGLWINKANDESYMRNAVNNGIDINIVGVLKVDEEGSDIPSGYVGYTHKLTEYVIDNINKQEIVRQQLNNNINVFTGKTFDGMLSSYENNLKTLGVCDVDDPYTINIYPKDFDSKENIEEIIKDYNDAQIEKGKEENVINYTDLIGVLLSSVTSIVNIISYVLIAFVAVSLVVSSIMIAIITYISVLERTKEIGILRAIGASKKDIRRVFNSETIIEGFAAGLMGVSIAYLLTIPANAIIKDALDVSNLTRLPFNAAVILVLISVFLTVIAGLIPANMASKKDPVESLRSE